MNKEFEKKYNELKSITTCIFRIYDSLINEDYNQKNLLDILNLLLEKESKIYDSISFNYDELINFVKYLNIDNHNNIKKKSKKDHDKDYEKNHDKIHEKDYDKNPIEFEFKDFEIPCFFPKIIIKRRIINNLRRIIENKNQKYIQSIEYNDCYKIIKKFDQKNIKKNRINEEIDNENKIYLFGKNIIIHNIYNKVDRYINVLFLNILKENNTNINFENYMYSLMSINKDLEDILIRNDLDITKALLECENYSLNLSEIEEKIYYNYINIDIYHTANKYLFKDEYPKCDKDKVIFCYLRTILIILEENNFMDLVSIAKNEFIFQKKFKKAKLIDNHLEIINQDKEFINKIIHEEKKKTLIK